MKQYKFTINKQGGYEVTERTLITQEMKDENARIKGNVGDWSGWGNAKFPGTINGLAEHLLRRIPHESSEFETLEEAMVEFNKLLDRYNQMVKNIETALEGKEYIYGV